MQYSTPPMTYLLYKWKFVSLHCLSLSYGRLPWDSFPIHFPGSREVYDFGARLQALWQFCCSLELAPQQLCWGYGAPFVSAPLFQGVRQGLRQLEPVASLAFTIYVNDKLSESNRGSLFLYQLNLSVLDSDFPLCLASLIIIGFNQNLFQLTPAYLLVQPTISL